MPKPRNSFFDRHRGFFYEAAAATPWRSRLHKASMYAALVWIIVLVGVGILKYVFHLLDLSIVSLLARSVVFPIVLFGHFIYCCVSADSTKRLYDQKDRKDEEA